MPATPPKLDWENPVTRPFVGGDWVKQLVNYWEAVLRRVHRIAVDPLLESDFRDVCTILDKEPQPTTVEEANARWREFLGALRRIVERAQQRADVKKRAAQKRGKGHGR